MKNSLVNLTYEIELEPGEKLTLPESLIAQVDTGRWLITIHPTPTPVRSHSAFLNSYVPEDEGLYDDYTPRITGSSGPLGLLTATSTRGGRAGGVGGTAAHAKQGALSRRRVGEQPR